MKYFRKVAYTQEMNKPIPHWAADRDLLDRVAVHQRLTENGEKVFGMIDPRKFQFELREVFQGLVNLIPGSRKQKKYDQRGDSA